MIASGCTVLHCIALHGIVLHGIALYCIVLYCTVNSGLVIVNNTAINKQRGTTFFVEKEPTIYS